jgi:MSHA biogenesis protein MshO
MTIHPHAAVARDLPAQAGNAIGCCRRIRLRRRRAAQGVTMVEMIVVVAVTGILIAAVTAFIARPIEGYFDSAAHAQLVGAADTALRRVTRDLHRALPNSVRVSAGGDLVQYVEVRTGGRYRAEPTSPSPGGCVSIDDPGVTDQTILSFGVADTCFKALSNDPDRGTIIPNADYVVIYNLGPDTPRADVYNTDASVLVNKALVTGVAPSGNEDLFTIAANNFTYSSPGNRFFVISGPVSYRCDIAAGTLTRYWGYAIQAAMPPDLTGASSALMATKVTGCSFSYQSNIANLNAGVVTINLTLSDARGGVVTLLQQAHVNNVP